MHPPENPDLSVRLGRVTRKSTEYILSTITLASAAIFILNPHVFEAPLYTLMRFLMPSQVWGIIFFVIGSIRFMMVWANGHVPIGPVVRRSFSILTQIIVWLPLTMSFWWWGIMSLGSVGEMLPGMVLAPGMLAFDLLAFATLSASIEAQKRSAAVSGVRGSDV